MKISFIKKISLLSIPFLLFSCVLTKYSIDSFNYYESDKDKDILVFVDNRVITDNKYFSDFNYIEIVRQVENTMIHNNYNILAKEYINTKYDIKNEIVKFGTIFTNSERRPNFLIISIDKYNHSNLDFRLDLIDYEGNQLFSYSYKDEEVSWIPLFMSRYSPTIQLNKALRKFREEFEEYAEPLCQTTTSIFISGNPSYQAA